MCTPIEETTVESLKRHRLIPGTASNERFHKSCRIFPGSVWNRPAPICIK
ncbi:unnamed protein product [Trichogramma brassicae]|uniref:Uncharacterized protein n=1 Tax=Trichogramma brassicae TaxID=86971 RepID=A0A6H5IEE1_9HYME|nr:unnamed protein product [Trichogramma brassicae]